MATPQQRFAEELDAISARYESQFAGMPRSSRNLDEIDAIIRDTKGVLGRITSIPDAVRPPDLSELAETARQNVALYERERALIVEARRVGPDFEHFARLAASANTVFARYRRHFAGQSRTTRDIGLLGEMVEELESIEEAMGDVVRKAKAKELSSDLELVRNSLRTYREELDAIAKARKDGTPEERVGMWASLANSQFAIYQNHFAGKSRSTRRPALLVRILDQLDIVHKGMKGLRAGGVKNENNDKNIEIVERQVEMYKKELDEVRATRKETNFGDLMGMLGGAANTVFDTFRTEFAGKDRKALDLAKLSALCDELIDVRKQMIELGRAEDSATNEGNIDIVTSQLVSFEQEWEQIQLAQK
jgi:hypothetical protein